MIRIKKKYPIILLCLLSLTSCGKKEVSEEILRPVRFQQVRTVGNKINKSFSGTASSGIQSSLSFKVNGTLIKRMVSVGDRVKKGQIIAELDATDYLIQKQEMEASLDQSRAQIRNSKANYDRVKVLYESDNVSKSDLDIARATYDSNKAALEALEQKLDLANLKTKYTKLIAPFDGIVGEVYSEENENVSTEQGIVSIQTEGDIKVVVGVPETFISRIETGTTVLVRFASIDTREFEAIVSEVSYSIAGVSTYPVSVVLNNPSADVRPGMVADVIFRFVNSNRTEQSMIVPPNAVSEDGAGKFVFILKKIDQDVATVHRRKVEIYKLTNEGFEIKSGLTDGDLVVTAGISKLTDEMRVKFIQ